MTDKLLSRKFWLCVVVQLLLFLFLWNGKISQEVVQNLTGLVITSYIIGNVAQRTLVKDKTNESS
jgi:hypothetical protein